jgi:hypothetical protein
MRARSYDKTRQDKTSKTLSASSLHLTNSSAARQQQYWDRFRGAHSASSRQSNVPLMAHHQQFPRPKTGAVRKGKKQPGPTALTSQSVDSVRPAAAAAIRGSAAGHKTPPPHTSIHPSTYPPPHHPTYPQAGVRLPAQAGCLANGRPHTPHARWLGSAAVLRRQGAG